MEIVCPKCNGISMSPHYIKEGQSVCCPFCNEKFFFRSDITNHKSIQKQDDMDRVVTAIFAIIIGVISSIAGCCCFPLSVGGGIVALIFAIRTKMMISSNDIVAAKKNFDIASICIIVSFCGSVINIVFFYIRIFHVDIIIKNFLERI